MPRRDRALGVPLHVRQRVAPQLGYAGGIEGALCIRAVAKRVEFGEGLHVKSSAIGAR